MMRQYERILDEYKVWYPTLYSRTVECRPSGRHMILVTLDDKSKIEFCSLDGTIRDVTKLYEHESIMDMQETEWRKEFGHRLRRAMENSGINQEHLSEKMGISRQMLSRYSNGNATPSSYIVTKLSEVLKCDIRDLTKFSYIDKD